MRVLVTGATTPFGAKLIEQLLARSDVELVLASGREPHGERRDPDVRPDGRTDDRLRYLGVDLTHQRSLRDLIWGPARSHRIDSVVHGIHHRKVRDTGRSVHVQNVETARALILACADHPTIRRLVYRSFAEVYALRHTTSDLIDEEAPLDFAPTSPQWVRDRVEADTTVCAHLADPLRIAVLRFAEILVPETGSQLWDYLSSRVCLRPMGFDPMINVLSIDDAARATVAALHSTEVGVFNIRGLDTLPLSCAIAQSLRADIPIPGPLMAPLYGLRRWIAGFEFRYDMNVRRFHFGGVLDGRRAAAVLGYTPRTPVQWPRPWWRLLQERLGQLRGEFGEP